MNLYITFDFGSRSWTFGIALGRRLTSHHGLVELWYWVE
jgi:hypothetical protein